jgi:regulator of replication initiation timing
MPRQHTKASNGRSPGQLNALERLHASWHVDRTCAIVHPSPSPSNPVASTSLQPTGTDIEHELKTMQRRELYAKTQLKNKRRELQDSFNHTSSVQSTQHALAAENHCLRLQVLSGNTEMHNLCTSLATAHSELSDTWQELEQVQASVGALETRMNQCGLRQDALRKRLSRAETKHIHDLDEALGRVIDHHTRHVQLKEHGKVKLEIRVLIQQLLSAGLSTTVINKVIHRVAGVFGILVDDNVSERSSGRIGLESLIIAKLQLAVEMAVGQGAEKA